MVNIHVIKLASIAGIGGFLFGFDTGVISGALPSLSKHFQLTSFLQELVVSSAIFGAIIGAAGGGPASDRYGRKPAIMLASILFTIGAVLMAAAPDVPILVLGRFFAGCGVGLASMSVPVYIAEVAPTSVRGALVGGFVLFVTGGQFISYCIDYAFAETHEGWRYMLGISGVPALLQLIGMFFVPESPRWLAMQGDFTRSERVLFSIRGGGSPRKVKEEMSIILNNIGEDVPFLSGVGELFRTNRRALVVGLGLQALQQLCGINTVMYYSTSIVRLAGFTGQGESVIMAIPIAFTNFVFTIVSLVLIDRVGRRKLLLGTIPCFTASLVLLGTAFFFMEQQTPALPYQSLVGGVCGECTVCNGCVGSGSTCGFCQNGTLLGVVGPFCVVGDSAGPDAASGLKCDSSDWLNDVCPSTSLWRFASLPAMAAYICFFAIGMGPVPWAVNSEIFPPRLRSTANALATIVNWSVNLLVSLTFLTLVELLTPHGAFFLYAGMGVLAWLFVFFLLPETANLPMEEIQKMFRSSQPYSTTDILSSEKEKKPLLPVVVL